MMHKTEQELLDIIEKEGAGNLSDLSDSQQQRLFLAQEALLKLQDMQRLFAPRDLTVFSACKELATAGVDVEELCYELVHAAQTIQKKFRQPYPGQLIHKHREKRLLMKYIDDPRLVRFRLETEESDPFRFNSFEFERRGNNEWLVNDDQNEYGERLMSNKAVRRFVNGLMVFDINLFGNLLFPQEIQDEIDPPDDTRDSSSTGEE